MENKNFVHSTYKKLNISYFVLAIIILFGALLRFHKLTAQSLVSNELQTFINGNPALSLSGFFESLRANEKLHPPLFFFFERCFFSIFGYTPLVGRSLCAIAGLASIFAMFRLGKEIKNEKLGLTAAALTCINYYNISFSQEAVNYIFIWLFSALSYLFFLKAYRHAKNKYYILLTISLICLVYTHYFGFLVVLSQLITIFVLLIQDKNIKKLITPFIVVYALVFISFIPWLSNFQSVLFTDTPWIAPLKAGFLVDFFYEYFGNNIMIGTAALFFMILYVIQVFLALAQSTKLKDNPAIVSFVLIFIPLFVSIGLPYLRSILMVPTLLPKYTIIALPSIIIAIAYGIEIIPNNIPRYLALSVFIGISVYNLILVNKFYRSVDKEQFREASQYMASANNKLPIVNLSTSDQYYLKNYNYKGNIFDINGAHFFDTLVKNKKWDELDTFWFTSFNEQAGIAPQNIFEHNKFYIPLNKMFFVKASVQLCVSSLKHLVKNIDNSYFKPEVVISDQIVIWSSTPITAKPVYLPKGKYIMAIESTGTPVRGVYPHNDAYINEKFIGSFYSKFVDTFSQAPVCPEFFTFEIDRDTMATLKIHMDNDEADSATKEDRNTTIQNIVILK